jgi:hypothetical protein
MNFIYKILPAISGFRPSYGTLIIVAFVILALASTFRQGKGGVLRNIISLYMTIAVNNFLPFLNLEIKGFRVENSPTLKVALFVIIFLLISFLLSRSSLASLDTSRSTLLNTLILSFLGSGLLISTISVMLPEGIKDELSGTAHFLFVNEIARFIWVLAPIIFTVLIG